MKRRQNSLAVVVRCPPRQIDKKNVQVSFLELEQHATLYVLLPPPLAANGCPSRYFVRAVQCSFLS